jgi:hypothetical protein
MPTDTITLRHSDKHRDTERHAREDAAYSRTPSRTCDCSDCRKSLPALASVGNRLNVARTRRLVGVTARETVGRIARHDDCRDSQERAACYLHHFTREVRAGADLCRCCRPCRAGRRRQCLHTHLRTVRTPTHWQALNLVNNGGQLRSGRGARSSSYDERRTRPKRTTRRSFYVTARALRGRAMRFCILA